MSTLYDKLGQQTLATLSAMVAAKKILAIHYELKGARVILASAETILLPGLDKDETVRLALYLGFNCSTGPDGDMATPAFAPHLEIIGDLCTEEVAHDD